MEMDGSSRKEEACCLKLLDLISKERKWPVNRDGNTSRHGSSDDKKLELRLGPPGNNEGDNCSSTTYMPKISTSSSGSDESLLTLGYFSSSSVSHDNGSKAHNKKMAGAHGCQDQKQKQVLPPSAWTCASGCHQHQQLNGSSFIQHRTSRSKPLPPTAVTDELSQPCCTSILGLQGAAEKKLLLPSSCPAANTAVPSTSQKRAAAGPVVGWPPIRSFRKNLASTSTSAKPVAEPQATATPSKNAKETRPIEKSGKGLFVKINMEGVSIGRKVDLHAYDSYEKLSFAVDELFRGLLAAQRHSSGGGGGVHCHNKVKEEEKAITGLLLDGGGEYALVYEDNEGDKMLVGDVPWHMFVSTVKRLRVLKSNNLTSLIGEAGKQGMKVRSSAK